MKQHTLRGKNSRGRLDDFPLDAPAVQLKPLCIFCDGEVEASPMLPSVCYNCFRTKITFIGAHNAHELNGVTK